MTAKWKLNRAGLFNFWYYDNEIFHFEDGKLLLRGANGSGKSVTMQSLLPVLLDGKKSPDRLDPFGSRSRRMADYLLGEKEVSDRDERTGYLFIEYKMEGTEQYLTTGTGMQAKRNQPLKSWGFVITDNRRIGYDLQLYKHVNQNGERHQFPLSQTELTTVIGAGGEVVNSNQDYMRLVNRYVFGFETIEAYDDLIKLLIQLRSPKLSKDFKPTVIYEILEEALPPLTDDDLRYLSDSIEQMDQTKQQMEQLEREVQALAKLNSAYDAYSEQIFADQVKEWKQTEARARKEEEELVNLRSQLLELERDFELGQSRMRELKIRHDTLSEQHKRLESHEVFQLEVELQQKQNELHELHNELKEQNQRLDQKIKRVRETRDRINELESRAHKQKQQIKDAIDDLSYEAQESAFSKHELNLQDYDRNEGGPFGFENWKREIEEHTLKLEAALEELRQRDHIIKQFQDRNHELSIVTRKHDELLDEERRWQSLLSEEKQALIHRIHLWVDEQPQYEVTDSAKQQMMRCVDELFSQYPYEEVKALFMPFVEGYEESLRIEQAAVSSRKNHALEEKEQWQAQLKQLRSMRDPEPKRHEATLDARRQLDEKGIVHKPLYEVVEFKPDVPFEVQVRLESALTETGLLDALVTSNDIEFKHDRVLLSEPKLFTATLADYLQPDSALKVISFDRVESVLQSIEMNGEAPVYFSEDGSYRFGSLQGHALPMDEVRFIGREARRRYREQLLAELEAEIARCSELITALEEQQQELEDRLQRSKRAWQAFPSSDDVKTCHNELAKNAANIQLQEGRIHEISEQLTKLDQELQESKRKLYELTHGLSLEPKVDSYQHALKLARQYEKSLNDIHREHDQWLRLLADQGREHELLVELEDETDDLRGTLNVMEDKKLKFEQQIQHIQQQQQLKGAEDVRREIQRVSNELSAVGTELEQLRDRLPRLDAERKQTVDRLDEKQSTHDFWCRMQAAWQDSVLKEWKRGTVSKGHEDLNEAVLSQYIKKSMKDRSDLEGQLTKLYYSLQPDLTEHKMNQYTDSPDFLDWMKAVDREEWKPMIEQWKIKNTRNIIEFDQRGVKISPAVLYETVSRELAIQETRIDEMDKQLYEEILLNSVGHKLRARIRRAEQWTEKMKGLMESRDTSSGLKFSIRWKPKTADSEEELDTQDLVSLLKQDANLLNDDDLARITRHFRSKIQSAKVWLEEKGDGQTLLQVLKHVLDYRKWFSFVLYYERPNEGRRELTNHHFFKFSGGEKAMAMYIPLFTACYSRYLEAAPSAPFIITLDEAFAGVDENNINEMFEIVEQLGFNYMMNSQVLWGDYEAVQALSVYDLIRPKNADYVTVIRYKWNGQELLLDEEGETDQREEREVG